MIVVFLGLYMLKYNAAKQVIQPLLWIAAAFYLVACGTTSPPVITDDSRAQLTAPLAKQDSDITADDIKSEADDIKSADNDPLDNVAPDNVTLLEKTTPIKEEAITEDNSTAFDTGTDTIASIIWEIEQADAKDKQDEKPTKTFEELIPEGPDPSLAEEALDAAFAMLKAPEILVPEAPKFQLPIKQDGNARIGIFAPLSGPRQPYGKQIQQGAELAFFQLADPRLELIYFDTSNSDALTSLAQSAVQAEIDIAIGPLFSDAAEQVFPTLRRHNIPLLSLSNNSQIAKSGLWVLGLLPEQQIDSLIAATMLNGYADIAILSDQSAYGAQLTAHIISRLKAFGLAPATVMIVDGTVGADDEGLIANLKQFTRYRPLEEDEFIDDKPVPYDAVIIAGGGGFILKVAPLLSYYDLGPDRVLYLGTDLWTNAALVTEPSLQGAFVATLDPALRADFSKRYQALFDMPSSPLGQLGFDGLAVAATALSRSQISEDGRIGKIDAGKIDAGKIDMPASIQSPIITNLVSEQGFKGYTGAFRLLPNGINYRPYQIYQITDGAIAHADIAPKQITSNQTRPKALATNN